MVFVFFCISGVLGPLQRHLSVTADGPGVLAKRPLDVDARALAKRLDDFPGAALVIANDWPLMYPMDVIRSVDRWFGGRMVNAVHSLDDTKEEGVLHFMSSRKAPFVILSTPDFEFSERTATERICVDPIAGVDTRVLDELALRLHAFGEDALRPLSQEDIQIATIDNVVLRRLLTLRGKLTTMPDASDRGGDKTATSKSTSMPSELRRSDAQ